MSTLATSTQHCIGGSKSATGEKQNKSFPAVWKTKGRTVFKYRCMQILYVEIPMESICTQTKTRPDKQVYQVHKTQVQYTKYQLYFYTLAMNNQKMKEDIYIQNKTKKNKVLRN